MILFVPGQFFQSLTGERIESDDIENGHKTDPHITKIPYEGISCDTADEEHDQSQELIEGLPAPFIPEKISHVTSGIENNAEKSGKAEEEQREGNEDHAELSQMVVHGCLQECHTGKTGNQIFRNKQHDHGGTAADHDGVDEDTERLNQACLGGLITFGCGCRTGSRAGTGFIGEQSSFHSIHENGAETAGHRLAHTKGFFKDPGKNAGKQTVIDCDDKERDEEVADGHNGDNGIQNLYGCMLPENDDSRNDHQKDARVKGRDGKSVLKRRSDRVTDNLTDAAPADQAGDGKQYRKQHVSFFPSQPFLHQMMDIIGRASAVSAIERILFFVQLGKSRFNKCCGRTDDGGDPHPENGSGTAGRDSSHDTYQIAHTHTGGGGYDERLEGGEAVFVAFRSFQRPEHIRKEPDRKKTGPDGKKDTGRDQKQDQKRNTDAAASGKRDLDEIAPEKVVDGADYLNDHNISSFHLELSPLCHKKRFV